MELYRLRIIISLSAAVSMIQVSLKTSIVPINCLSLIFPILILFAQIFIGCNGELICNHFQRILNEKRALVAGNPQQEYWINTTEIIWNCNCNAERIIRNISTLSPEIVRFTSFEPLHLNLTDNENVQIPDEPVYEEIIQYIKHIQDYFSDMMTNIQKNLFDESQLELLKTLNGLKSELKPEILQQVSNILNKVFEKAEDDWFILDSESEVLNVSLEKFSRLIGDVVNSSIQVGQHDNGLESTYKQFRDRLNTKIMPGITSTTQNNFKHLKMMSSAVNDLVEVQRGLATIFNDLLSSNELPI